MWPIVAYPFATIKPSLSWRLVIFSATDKISSLPMLYERVDNASSTVNCHIRQSDVTCHPGMQGSWPHRFLTHYFILGISAIIRRDQYQFTTTDEAKKTGSTWYSLIWTYKVNTNQLPQPFVPQWTLKLDNDDDYEYLRNISIYSGLWVISHV